MGRINNSSFLAPRQNNNHFLPDALFLLCAIFLLFSCSTTPESQEQRERPVYHGVYHLVKKGETFWSIAKAYNFNLQELAEINNISNPDLIEEDSVIFIPDANQVIEDVMTAARAASTSGKIDNGQAAKTNEEESGTPIKKSKDSMPATTVPPVKTEKAKPLKAKSPEEKLKHPDKVAGDKPGRKIIAKASPEAKDKIHFDKKRFIWPVRGSVKTRFGIQPNKTYHNWIKIVSRAGETVSASASGIVIFSSALKDFGETVIIRHEENYATVYTHLKKSKVKTDQTVKRGEPIAIVGQRDEAGEAYINFEVRLRGKARNPLFFLP